MSELPQIPQRPVRLTASMPLPKDDSDGFSGSEDESDDDEGRVSLQDLTSKKIDIPEGIPAVPKRPTKALETRQSVTPVPSIPRRPIKSATPETIISEPVSPSLPAVPLRPSKRSSSDESVVSAVASRSPRSSVHDVDIRQVNDTDLPHEPSMEDVQKTIPATIQEPEREESAEPEGEAEAEKAETVLSGQDEVPRVPARPSRGAVKPITIDTDISAFKPDADLTDELTPQNTAVCTDKVEADEFDFSTDHVPGYVKEEHDSGTDVDEASDVQRIERNEDIQVLDTSSHKEYANQAELPTEVTDVKVETEELETETSGKFEDKSEIALEEAGSPKDVEEKIEATRQLEDGPEIPKELAEKAVTSKDTETAPKDVEENTTPVPVIPKRPRKAVSSPLDAPKPEEVATHNKISEVLQKKKAPPPIKPKKPSSKIAAFQQMFGASSEKAPPLVPSRPMKVNLIRSSTADSLPGSIDEEASSVEEKTQTQRAVPGMPNRLASSRVNFAKNLNGMIGMALPGMVPAEALAFQPDESEETKECDQEEVPVSKDLRKGRAKGPRGRKLPTSAVEPVVEAKNKYSIVVADLWSVGLSEKQTEELPTGTVLSENRKAPESSVKDVAESTSKESEAVHSADPEGGFSSAENVEMAKVEKETIDEPLERSIAEDTNSETPLSLSDFADVGEHTPLHDTLGEGPSKTVEPEIGGADEAEATAPIGHNETFETHAKATKADDTSAQAINLDFSTDSKPSEPIPKTEEVHDASNSTDSVATDSVLNILGEHALYSLEDILSETLDTVSSDDKGADATQTLE
ncbi:hypothetical protein BABINDRAFT_161418 [Babjeviella inositovora NRRL Y-12698]|uniref:Altered inheritance of mitochondria protein 21 n=1 Tax=Babjeviella inositovora NRRL Y-12698 TaxID=984486 RepID=A0A1E3QQE1_9ASCO|nr:uncharacterized protein BABINDRAFT_161418 [Babjeviella inositovora NRRL Y-12698]ODQ79704.1 hypothetical protein BABINDRAFT_161418 [Babjeviella inositovora NRRL Y-12698]